MMQDYSVLINRYIDEEKEILGKINVFEFNRSINLLKKTLEEDGVVYIFGNGGSSSTASHFQNDFNKGISEHIDKKFRFYCLNDNVATLMAIANDIGFDEVF